MKSLSEVIADFYIEKNIISSDMKSVYVYGISLIINDIIDFAVWRTEFCRWLYKNKDELSQFLKNQYKGILL